MPTADFDALIVGAGPAGASAATLLARAGWSVALVEQENFPRRKVCGECIAASNLPLLDALGIGEAVAREAGPELRRVALMRGVDSVIADLPPAATDAVGAGGNAGDGSCGIDGRRRWGRAFGRERLDTLLLGAARAAGATVLQPWSVQRLDGSPGDWRIGLREVGTRQALTLRAPVAIAAHGSWQPLPDGRAQHRERRGPADLLAFKANFRDARLADGLLPVLAFDGGYGGMVVADDGLATLACCIRRDRLAACRSAAPGASAGEAVGAMLERECAGVRDALRGALRVGPWLAAGPLAPGIRLRADDGLLRIGNAAGEAHPILGEGLSMALQSAWLLCARLVEAQPGGDGGGAVVPDAARQAELARRYAADWRRAFAPRLRLASAFAHAAMRPATAGLLLALARRWPGLLTHGARHGGKIRCAVDPARIGGWPTARPRAQEAP